MCDVSPPTTDFKERISNGGNTCRLQLQNFSLSETAPQSSNSSQFDGENAAGPSNSTKIHGGNAPGSPSSSQAPLVCGSKAPPMVGAAAPTTSATLKSADKVMKSNLDLCIPSNVRP